MDWILPIFTLHIGRLMHMSGAPYGLWFMWRPVDGEGRFAPKRSSFGFTLMLQSPIVVHRLGN